LPGQLEQWFAADASGSKSTRALLEVLQTPQDVFWSRHWTFRSAQMSKPKPLIGPPRISDLAVNVILPWFWIRAVVGHNDSFQRRAEERYFAWPKSEDNTVLRLALQRHFVI